MASRQSVSSILKPPKVLRAPLKEIETVDQDADENTATSSKRKVSFSGMNKIKMYNTCATSLTVNQAPMFDEKNSISSDTLNGDGTKTPGKFDKSDVQTTFESTDCTNVENNGRVIIEYESPSDNMEMTEAKVGKLHESMFLIDNYDSECMNSSLDNSETNMEFTEAKVGNIFTADDLESDFSSTEMSETLYSEGGNNLGTNISTSLPDISKTKIFDKSSNSNIMEFTCTNTKSNFAAIESSNMEFTCTNTKLNSMASESCNMEFTCTNTKSNSLAIESSNMELSCMTVKFEKSAALNHSSSSMELTQVPDKQISEDCNELMYETSIESDTSYDGKNNSNCELEIEPNIVYTKTKRNNDLNHETNVCKLKNSDENDDFSDDLSLSMVSMDVDPTLEFNAFVKNNIVLDNSDLVTNELDSSNSIVVMSTEVDNIIHPVDITLDNLNKTDINYQNSKTGISILPTGSSFVQEMSPEKNIDKSLQTLKHTLNNHTSMFDQSQYIVKKKSMVPKENKQRKYSRKTKSHKELVAEIGLEKCIENHDNVFVAAEENQQIKPSIVPTSVFNQSQFYEDKNSSDISVKNEANHEINYSRKSIAPTFVFNQSQYVENEDISDKSIIDEEMQQNGYSRKSIVAHTNMADEVQSFYANEDVSYKSTIDEESKQKMYSRKSIALTNMDHEVQSIYENEDISDKSTVDEENQRNRYSRKSIAPTNMANEVQSFYANVDVSDKFTTEEESQQKMYSRKSVAFTNMANEVQSIYENEDISDKSIIDEEIQQNRYSRKSIVPTNLASEVQSIYENEYSSDKSTVDEENQGHMYSRKSIVPTSINESAPDISKKLIEFEQKRCSIKLVASMNPTTVHNQTRSPKNENVSSNTFVAVEENVKKGYSRKSIRPASIFNEALEDYMPDNLLSSAESNGSLITSNNDMKQLCTSNKKKSALKSEFVLFGVINDDDLNSPFRKKSKKSINLTNQSVEISLNENDDDDNQSENVEYESKMDISMEYESKNDDEANISSQKINMTESISIEAEENHAKHENLDDDKKKEKMVLPSNELVVIERDTYEPIENHELVKGDEQSEDIKNNKSTKINDYVNKTNCTLNSKDNSLRRDFDTVTNTICVEGISNMSITDESNLCVEKFSTGNRKRSFSSRDCAPLSCSSFVSKSIVEDCTNKDFNKEEFLKESPIKINDAVSNKDSLLEDIVKVDLIKEESLKENLSNEVLEFLTRWTERFVEKKLSLVKCKNREWTFNILDGNITLTIFFSNDHSFLKVENISFEIKSNAQNEIMMFGMQWILSKYNPKVYKQICFTSRDVELLLKSLLEDVHFISEVMNNMSYVKNIYCVTFKDNKAEIVLHKMMPAPMMVRIEILLSNIHKLSIKDITVDRLFGSFDSKLLDTILENKSKDCKVLQFLIEELRAAI